MPIWPIAGGGGGGGGGGREEEEEKVGLPVKDGPGGGQEPRRFAVLACTLSLAKKIL